MLLIGISLIPFVRPDLVEFGLNEATPPSILQPIAPVVYGNVIAFRNESSFSPPFSSGPGTSRPSADYGRWWREEPQSGLTWVAPSTGSASTELATDLQARTGVRTILSNEHQVMKLPELPPLAMENSIPSVAKPSPRIATVPTPVQLGLTVPKEIRRWESIILRASQKYGVDPNLVAALMQTESAGSPNALSSMNAVGLMQVMGGAFEPELNVDQGVHILSGHLRQYGAVDLALAAYNAGPGAVATYGGIPPYEETRRHIALTLASYKKFRGA